MAVATGAIVEGFDVIEDVGTREVTRFVDSFAHAFFLQAAEEGFGDRIVPAIAAPTHAGLVITIWRGREPMVDYVIIVHLEQRDVSMLAISRAPLEKLEAFKKRMGWTFKWGSSL